MLRLLEHILGAGVALYLACGQARFAALTFLTLYSKCGTCATVVAGSEAKREFAAALDDLTLVHVLQELVF